MSQGEIIVNFLCRGFRRGRCETKEAVRQDVGDSPVSLAMTHMLWCKGQDESADAHRVWSKVSVGGEPGPSTCARTRTRAEVIVRHRPLVNTDRHKDSG